jgi:beta-lactam-binding protein with PASTA domain
VDAEFGGDRVAEQNPSGQAPVGATITIRPGNGQGGTVPDVTGQNVNSARAAMLNAGYGNVAIGDCKKDSSAPPEGQVTGTNPAANSPANKNTTITFNVVAKDCPS